MKELSDAAAESLSNYQGELLVLDNLEKISDSAAEFLSKCKGSLSILDTMHGGLSDAAALSLSKHKGEINGEPAKDWFKSLGK